jgi:hypothetical protein
MLRDQSFDQNIGSGGAFVLPMHPKVVFHRHVQNSPLVV